MTRVVSESQWANAGQATKELLVGQVFELQKGAAHALDVSATQLSRILKGERAPRLETLQIWDQTLRERSTQGLNHQDGFVYQPGRIIDIWCEPDEPTRRQNPKVATLLGATALIIAATVVAALAFRQGSGEQATSATISTNASICDPLPAEFERDLAGEYSDWGGKMSREYVKARPFYNSLCPTEKAKPALGNSVVLQRLRDSENRRAFLVASDPANAVVMSEAQWLSYLEARQLVARDSPVPVPLRASTVGPSVIEMQDDSELVAADKDQRHVLVAEEVLDQWESSGGADGQFGWPVSNGYPEDDVTRYDFEGGYFLLGRTEPGVKAAVIPVGDKTRGLPPTTGASRLLALGDGSIWLEDANARAWVFSAETRACLENKFGPPVVVSGMALAKLPLGLPASCG